MRSLLDINVLLALMNEQHLHHQLAISWWRANRVDGWASCPLTQNGFVRLASQLKLPERRSIEEVTHQLRRQLGDADHEFWPDSVSITDNTLFDISYLVGHNQITDAYILGLAVKNGGRLVTFDRGVPLRAVKGAGTRHLSVLA